MKDGLQDVPVDRYLMRLKDILSILLSVGAIVYGGYKVVRQIDRMSDQIALLQQQVSSLQQLVVNDKRHSRRR